MKVAGGAIAVLTLLLWFVGSQWLNERDARVKEQIANAVNAKQREMELAKQAEIAELQTVYDKQITDLEIEHGNQINEFIRKLAQADTAATQKPLAFGDDLLRSFIRVDCLWSLGQDANSRSGRTTCDREAQATDAAQPGFSVITPGFLKGWSDACQDRGFIGENYTEQDWLSEYGNFDPQLCSQTLVAMTPEASVYMRIFLENGLNYTMRLNQYIEEQDQLIDQLIKGPAAREKNTEPK